MIRKNNKTDLSLVKRKKRRNKKTGWTHRKKLGPKSNLRDFKR